MPRREVVSGCRSWLMVNAEIPLYGKQVGRIKIVGCFLYAIFRTADGFSMSQFISLQLFCQAVAHGYC